MAQKTPAKQNLEMRTDWSQARERSGQGEGAEIKVIGS